MGSVGHTHLGLTLRLLCCCCCVLQDAEACGCRSCLHQPQAAPVLLQCRHAVRRAVSTRARPPTTSHVVLVLGSCAAGRVAPASNVAAGTAQAVVLFWGFVRHTCSMAAHGHGRRMGSQPAAISPSLLEHVSPVWVLGPAVTELCCCLSASSAPCSYASQDSLLLSLWLQDV
jgi:hypothetical protein